MLGQKIDAGAPLATVHAVDDAAAEAAVAAVKAAYQIGEISEPPELVRRRVV